MNWNVHVRDKRYTFHRTQFGKCSSTLLFDLNHSKSAIAQVCSSQRVCCSAGIPITKSDYSKLSSLVTPHPLAPFILPIFISIATLISYHISTLKVLGFTSQLELESDFNINPKPLFKVQDKVPLGKYFLGEYIIGNQLEINFFC